VHRSRFLAGIAVAAMLVAAGCGGGGGDSGGGGDNSGGGSQEDNALTIWTTEDVADRVTAQQKIMDGWAQKNGATVKLVAVAEDQLTTVLTSAAAANDLPDAIAALSLNGMNQLRTDDLVDPDAAKEVVDGLGADTFFKRTLELTSVDGEQIAVPSDGFSNLLFYRTDLLQAAGRRQRQHHAEQPAVPGGVQLLRADDEAILGCWQPGRRYHASDLLCWGRRHGDLVVVPA
jgi:multiple sugar transport system substrate-binding protein